MKHKWVTRGEKRESKKRGKRPSFISESTLFCLCAAVSPIFQTNIWAHRRVLCCHMGINRVWGLCKSSQTSKNTHTGARVHMVLPKQPSHIRVSAGQTFKRLSGEQGKHKGILRNEHFLAVHKWRVSQKIRHRLFSRTLSRPTHMSYQCHYALHWVTGEEI